MARFTTVSRHSSWGGHLGVLLAVGAALAHPPTAMAGSWQTAANMVEGRNYPKATLLADGSVLVTGGQGHRGGRDVALRSAERFDPKAHTFTALPPMTTERQGHAAVRLLDGRVLLVGGLNADGQVESTAELFDPALGTFSPTGAMHEQRFFPTATLLADGRVLVVGGWTRWLTDPVATAELYDPTTGRFEPTGSMAAVRAVHTAFALPDGRVAVVGGFGEDRPNRLGDAVRAVEIYDPTTGSFTANGELLGQRDGFASAVMLSDSRILISGGESLDLKNRSITDNTVEIYDPTTGKSSRIGTLNESREEHVSVLLPNGQVLVAGGWALPDSVSKARRTAELIDPATGKAALTEAMAGPRANATALLLPDGRALVVGGIYPGGHRKTAEVYTP